MYSKRKLAALRTPFCTFSSGTRYSFISAGSTVKGAHVSATIPIATVVHTRFCRSWTLRLFSNVWSTSCGPIALAMYPKVFTAARRIAFLCALSISSNSKQIRIHSRADTNSAPRSAMRPTRSMQLCAAIEFAKNASFPGTVRSYTRLDPTSSTSTTFRLNVGVVDAAETLHVVVVVVVSNQSPQPIDVITDRAPLEPANKTPLVVVVGPGPGPGPAFSFSRVGLRVVKVALEDSSMFERSRRTTPLRRCWSFVVFAIERK
mmetsp:Transcript_3346/g.11038  ORF Transcript_3346/g.11038 Transcript_3346/m.11038 type:complete len:261 (+) Transcript_3346:261-1043(+)